MSQGLEFNTDLARKMEALYSTPDVVAQRRRTLELLELASGEAVLDIGSGPGLLAHQMAAEVGAGGRLVGVDASADMLAMARRRCEEQPWAEFAEADATALPYPDATFDAAVSAQVYEYVADVPAALGELRRVLRPGGRAVIIDSDWHSIAFHSDHDERMARVMSAWDEHFVHPRLPRTLPAELRAAGLTVAHREAFPLLNDRYDDDTYAKPTCEVIASFVAGRRGVTQDEAEAWLAELAELGAQGRFFFCMNRYVFVARRPERADSGA